MEAVLAEQSHAALAAQYGISQVWVGKFMAPRLSELRTYALRVR